MSGSLKSSAEVALKANINWPSIFATDVFRNIIYKNKISLSRFPKEIWKGLFKPISCLHSTVNLHPAEVSLAKSVNICQLHDSSLSLSQG